MRLEVLQSPAFPHERHVAITTWIDELQLALDVSCRGELSYLALTSNPLGIELRYSRFQPVHLP